LGYLLQGANDADKVRTYTEKIRTLLSLVPKAYQDQARDLIKEKSGIDFK
jgi:hypothetical protein